MYTDVKTELLQSGIGKGGTKVFKLGKIYGWIFSTELGATLVSIALALSLPILLYLLPMRSSFASAALRKLRDEHIARIMANEKSLPSYPVARRLLVRALAMYAAFWLFFALFLAFGISAYMVFAIPGHTISFLATRSLRTAWLDLDLSASRFRRIYLALVLLTLLPGIVLYVLRFLA